MGMRPSVHSPKARTEGAAGLGTTAQPGAVGQPPPSFAARHPCSSLDRVELTAEDRQLLPPVLCHRVRVDAAARVGNPVHVDEQLRANPDDLVVLMRAGRVSPERVAMAAYLGDERALATGVETWAAGDDGAQSRARSVIRLGQLSKRARVWLVTACASHAVPPEAEEIHRFLQRVEQWCRGLSDQIHLTPTAAEAIQDSEGKGWRLKTHEDPWRLSFVPFGLSQAAAGTKDAEKLLLATLDTVTGDDEAEQAWQAQAIAAALLDPDWPPWEE